MTGSEKGKWTPASYEVQSAREDKANELYEALRDLVGQVLQAREGAGVYHNSKSMNETLAEAASLLSSLSGEAGK